MSSKAIIISPNGPIPPGTDAPASPQCLVRVQKLGRIKRLGVQAIQGWARDRVIGRKKYMSVFQLSKGFCEKYEKMIRDFWWGDHELGQRKVHWMAWDRMTRPKRAGGIGFRDMHLFNQALLARQGWRLIQNPDSLCARVLKSKYYPHGDILDTVFASGASPVWRAIEFGLELLKEGLIWRVGNGQKIQIKRDNWIPRKSGLKPAEFTRRSRLRWVNQLIQSDRKEWNVDLINKKFQPFDAAEICNIPLANTEVEDRVAWHFEKNGVFTVKSAYRLAATLAQPEMHNTSSPTRRADDRSIWDIIWKAEVPEKVKVFGWRAATSSLATKKNKFRRTITHDSVCTICGNEEEDEFHALVTCTKSAALRYSMKKEWSLPPENKFRKTGVDWLQMLLDPVNSDMRAKILLLFWRCWHLRDGCVHRDGKESIKESVNFLLRYSQELCVLSRRNDGGKENNQDPTLTRRTAKESGKVTNWNKPESGTVKLNTDASFMPESGTSYAGGVARNHEGMVFVAFSKRLNRCSSVEEAEARAALSGLRELAKIFNGPITLEMDCAVVAKEIQQGSPNRSACFALITDIQKMLQSFSSYNIQAVSRNCNSVAHELAAYARDMGECVLLGTVPDRVKQACENDCKNLPG